MSEDERPTLAGPSAPPAAGPDASKTAPVPGTGATVVTPVGAPAAAPDGWYPDPWTAGQRRYWSGERWTAHVFADRTVGEQAGSAARAGAANPFRDRHAAPPDPGAAPPPHWVGPHTTPVPVPFPVEYGAPVDEPSAHGSHRPLVWIGVALTLVAAMIIGFALTRIPTGTPAAAPQPTAPPTILPTPGPTTSPSNPVQPIPDDLARLGLRQSDVTGTVVVTPIVGGTQVQGQTTLDLCNANYPSEARRQERVQVAAIDIIDPTTTLLSTEAVRYDSPAGTAQAWSEIQSAVAACPSTPVTSPTEGTTLTTTFGQRPDARWASVAGVSRLAYDVTTTDALGNRQHIIVVYLMRGNILLGVYFPQPDGPQTSVQGQTTIPGIVHVFELRLAALPPSGAVGGGLSPSPGPTA